MKYVKKLYVFFLVILITTWNKNKVHKKNVYGNTCINVQKINNWNFLSAFIRYFIFSFFFFGLILFLDEGRWLNLLRVIEEALNVKKVEGRKLRIELIFKVVFYFPALSFLRINSILRNSFFYILLHS